MNETERAMVQEELRRLLLLAGHIDEPAILDDLYPAGSREAAVVDGLWTVALIGADSRRARPTAEPEVDGEGVPYEQPGNPLVVLAAQRREAARSVAAALFVANYGVEALIEATPSR